MHFVVPAWLCPLSLSCRKKILVRIFKVALEKNQTGIGAGTANAALCQAISWGANFIDAAMTFWQRRAPATPGTRPFNRKSHRFDEV
jgi:hypothetical protein